MMEHNGGLAHKETKQSLPRFTTMSKLSTRRSFAGLSAAGISAAIAQHVSLAADDANVRTEFLFDLSLTTAPRSEIGSDRIVVPVSSGTFEGPRLKGSVAGPSGDWIVQRRDGSRVLDLRALLQTDDDQRIYMTCRGIAYTPPGGSLYARILPMFETGAAKYDWLNNVVAVGVYRATPGKIVYRVYQIL